MAGLLSCEDGDAVSRLSKGDDCDGLGRLSVSNGGVVERGVMIPRPFTSFSWFLHDAGDVRVDFREEEDGEEDAEDEEGTDSDDPAADGVELTLICAPSERLKQGIFSRLTTGKDTLQKGRESDILIDTISKQNYKVHVGIFHECR